jgi:hypothetical protein
MPLRPELPARRLSTFDLPILPFLAPRVFQPWPSRGHRNFGSSSKALQSDPVNYKTECSTGGLGQHEGESKLRVWDTTKDLPRPGEAWAARLASQLETEREVRIAEIKKRHVDDLKKLAAQREREERELEEQRKREEEELMERRRREDEERRARVLKEEEDRQRIKAEQDEKRRVEMEERRRSLREAAEAELERLEDEMERKVEEGKRKLRGLDEKRKVRREMFVVEE